MGEPIDMRDLVKRAEKQTKEFDPRTYFKSGALFTGRDQDGQPCYLPLSMLRHVIVQGTTGTGKGRFLQVSAAQLIGEQEAVFYLDPKDDEYAAHVLYAVAEEHGREYRCIQLTANQLPQLNILEGATEDEVVRILEATFQLQDKGKPSDFYLAGDRKGIKRLAKNSAGKTCRDLFREACADPWYEEHAQNLLTRLEAIAEIRAINAVEPKVSLSDLIEQKAVVYVRGELDSDAIRTVMRMVFIRLIQIASQRSRLDGPLPMINIIADELRFQLSSPVLMALSTSRDKGVRLWLACQSSADVRAAEINLDKEAIEGILLENTPHKLTYRIEDPTTADKLAEKSGRIRIHQCTIETARNLMMVETVLKRSWRETQARRVESNEFLSLPPGWAIYMAGPDVQLLQIAPICVVKNDAALQIMAAKQSDDFADSSLDDIFSLSPEADHG
ncbi:MAG: TraM recognition domain-containing protein [Moraxellaceae bacterium]|nr:TraM recognition domain-containing protein [Moraxellaceae bacterium]